MLPTYGEATTVYPTLRLWSKSYSAQFPWIHEDRGIKHAFQFHLKIPKTNLPWAMTTLSQTTSYRKKKAEICRDAPFGFEATAGWVAMSHPRSCRDRRCSSSPWGFVQKKLLVSLCLAWWWSGNWLRDALDMLQWSQINRWRGVSGHHHCTTTDYCHPHTHPHHHPHHASKCAQSLSSSSIYLSLLWFEVVCPPPEHNKTTLQPTRSQVFIVTKQQWPAIGATFVRHGSNDCSLQFCFNATRRS